MLEAGYVLLFVVLICIIIYVLNVALTKNNIDSNERRKTILTFVGVLSAWLGIQFLVLDSGFYLNDSLPPRLPLFMILPLFLFTGIFLYLKRNSEVLHSIPIHIPIAYQSFRTVIELLFWFTFAAGILPIQVTFEGANYDVLLGISAIFVAIYAYRKTASKKFLILWNVIGIFVVGWAAFTFITSFYFPSIWDVSESIFLNGGFLKFPFVLLPLFFMPSAVFMHVLSIVQLKRALDLEQDRLKMIPA